MERIGKKYRLGNQDTEYALVTDYLGWVPKGFEDWNKWYHDKEKKKYADRNWQIGDPDPTKEIVVVGPTGGEATLLFDHEIIKDAFPMEVYGDKRFQAWHQFVIVANPSEPDIKFVIPMH